MTFNLKVAMSQLEDKKYLLQKYRDLKVFGWQLLLCAVVCASIWYFLPIEDPFSNVLVIIFIILVTSGTMSIVKAYKYLKKNKHE